MQCVACVQQWGPDFSAARAQHHWVHGWWHFWLLSWQAVRVVQLGAAEQQQQRQQWWLDRLVGAMQQYGYSPGEAVAASVGGDVISSVDEADDWGCLDY